MFNQFISLCKNFQEKKQDASDIKIIINYYWKYKLTGLRSYEFDKIKEFFACNRIAEFIMYKKFTAIKNKIIFVYLIGICFEC